MHCTGRRERRCEEEEEEGLGKAEAVCPQILKRQQRLERLRRRQAKETKLIKVENIGSEGDSRNLWEEAIIEASKVGG